MAITFFDDFADLSQWTNNGGVSIAPAGFAYHPGDGSGGGGLHRPQGTAKAVEVGVYGDASGGDNWLTVKLNGDGTQPLYNSDGDGLLLRSTNGQVSFFSSGGTATPTFYLPVPPQSAGTLVRVGVYVPASGHILLYYNRAQVGELTGGGAYGGNQVQLGGYNGIGAHFDYALLSDEPLTMFDFLPHATGETY